MKNEGLGGPLRKAFTLFGTVEEAEVLKKSMLVWCQISSFLQLFLRPTQKMGVFLRGPTSPSFFM